MFLSEKREIPHVPPSLNLNSWEKQGGPNPPSSPSTQPSQNEITPYLGLRARLSQIWLNRWTVLLLLVLVHFLLTASSLQSGLDDSKERSMSACKKVEDTGSAMASMPHYLSRGVNSLVADGITSSVHALMTVLEMIITSVEQLILFFIHMMTDTYVCLITMAVHGALNVSAIVVEKTTEAMNKAIDGFADGLMKTTDGIQKAIDGGWEALEKVTDVADKIEEGAQDTGDKIIDGAKGAGDTLKGVFGGGRRRDFIPMIEPPPLLAEPRSTVLLVRDLPPTSTVTLVPRIDIGAKPDVKKPLNEFFQSIKDLDIDSAGFVDSINKLNKDLPSFDEVRNKTDETIGIPFDLVRNALDEAYGNWSFDKGIFPVAQREQLSFCSENSAISDFFDGLYEIARKAKIAAVVVLAALAVLACAPMVYWERVRWARQARYAELFSRNQYDHLDVAYMYSRPHTARAGLSAMKRLEGWRLSRKKQVLARWCVAYATSLPALFVLSLALAGFFSCACQAILLRAVEKQIPALSEQVGEFAEEVVYSLGNVSKRWSDDANGVIDGFSTDINDDVLGHVTRATSAVNDTINTFTRTMDEGLTKVLGDTPFRDAAAGVIRCVVGLKVETVQKGLTWVHDHARVELPRFPADLYSVGAEESIAGDSEVRSFLAAPGSGTADEVTEAVLRVTSWLRNSIVQEALISLALFLVYALVVLAGVVWALARTMSPDGDDRDAAAASVPPYPPRSPRRSKSLGEIESPRFYEQGGDPFADNYRMDSREVVRGRSEVQHPGDARSSSHGYVDTVGRS